MIRDLVRETSTKLGVDDQLRKMRSMTNRYLRRESIDNEHLKLLIRFALAEDSNCIDIGCYRGEVLSEMMRVAPRGKHIAYEPQPKMYNYLVTHFPSAEVRQAAASNEIGETSFTYVKNFPGMSGLRERSYPSRPQIEKLTVRTETLDQSLPEGYIPALIKIDVEGAERQVFEGAIEIISKFQPVIAFEHGKKAASHYNTRPRHIYELLHDKADLRIFDMDGNGPLTLKQLEDIYESGSRWNFVAHR